MSTLNSPVATADEKISLLAAVAPNAFIPSSLVAALYAHAHADSTSAVCGYLGGILPASGVTHSKPARPGRTKASVLSRDVIRIDHFLASERRSSQLLQRYPQEVPWALDAAVEMFGKENSHLVGWYRSEPGNSLNPTQDDLRRQWTLQIIVPIAIGFILAAAGDASTDLVAFRTVCTGPNRFERVPARFDIIKAYAMDTHYMEEMLYSLKMSLQESDQFLSDQLADASTKETDDGEEEVDGDVDSSATRLSTPRSLIAMEFRSYLDRFRAHDIADLIRFIEREYENLSRRSADERWNLRRRTDELWELYKTMMERQVPETEASEIDLVALRKRFEKNLITIVDRNTNNDTLIEGKPYNFLAPKPTKRLPATFFTDSNKKAKPS